MYFTFPLLFVRRGEEESLHTPLQDLVPSNFITETYLYLEVRPGGIAMLLRNDLSKVLTIIQCSEIHWVTIHNTRDIHNCSIGVPVLRYIAQYLKPSIQCTLVKLKQEM